MSPLLSFFTSIDPRNKPGVPLKVQLSEIDREMRVPVVLFVISAILWLQAGTLFALVASIKLHNPEFLGNVEWLTFGRARSAHLNAMAFGWGNNAIFAVALWIMARLCKVSVKHGGLLVVAGAFWNIGVTAGVIGILTGGLTSVEWLEMPMEVAPLLAVSYILVAVWGVIMFRFRALGHVYVSQWYILGALFWFPWLYVIAQTMILWVPARGTVQAITNWWFGHNVLGLWLTPMGLGAIYYFLPKVLGRPIHSYYLSVLGFWSLALFYNWAGVHHLIGGPIPVWLVSAGIVGSIMMVIPVVVTAINHHMTAAGNWRAVWCSPTLRFIVFGGMSYTLASLAGSAMALRDVNVITHFTQFTVGHAHHGVYAFFTMTMFGGIYFMMPRILNREWPSAALIRTHFWCAAIGITIMMVVLHVGGWIQGEMMIALDADGKPKYAFLEIVAALVPWLFSRSLSGILLSIGHLAFLVNFFWMLAGGKSSRAQEGPTLLADEHEEEVR
ncbi:cbb3-type cytochrome c oxidase subunit I [Ruficoccus sp. ZRK36]|uniref:cbb3-type cytochrome c oxidase subunit I n=1 Tax=Ruficoccus sp. ZRK36 TaxID=2866311 RepID=UPI001C731AB8|nr:cbb3-type cytochrome c oxidase subunit I [Ruficoccus sp. ZRK36]QYY36092.1 cbb3-type cytochrome c oxidase subunit I [Ruficoccus sp. ZRK36]